MTVKPDANDPWALDNGRYSPDKVYCKSVDTKGHGTTVRLNLTPYVKNTVETLLRDPAMHRSYQGSIGAFIRDAVAHRVKHYKDNMPQQVADEFSAWLELQRKTEQIAVWKQMCEDAISALEAMRDAGVPIVGSSVLEAAKRVQAVMPGTLSTGLDQAIRAIEWKPTVVKNDAQ